MINQMIVDILVRRIRSGGVNPKTGVPMVAKDILHEGYRVAFEQELKKGDTR